MRYVVLRARRRFTSIGKGQSLTDWININTASAAEFDAVPALKGHGFEIVRYRDERGGFTNLRQLDEVPGLTGKADGLEASLTIKID